MHFVQFIICVLCRVKSCLFSIARSSESLILVKFSVSNNYDIVETHGCVLMWEYPWARALAFEQGNVATVGLLRTFRLQRTFNSSVA